MSGKQGIAPCGHSGTYVTPNFITCNERCEFKEAKPVQASSTDETWKFKELAGIERRRHGWESAFTGFGPLPEKEESKWDQQAFTEWKTARDSWGRDLKQIKSKMMEEFRLLVGFEEDWPFIEAVVDIQAEGLLNALLAGDRILNMMSTQSLPFTHDRVVDIVHSFKGVHGSTCVSSHEIGKISVEVETIGIRDEGELTELLRNIDAAIREEMPLGFELQVRSVFRGVC